MKVERLILSFLILVMAGAAAFYWKKAAALELENIQLQGQVTELEGAVATSSSAAKAQLEELKRMRQQTSELMSLRNEVTQLRTSRKAADDMQAEVGRLKAENQQLRQASASAPPLPALPPTNAAPAGPRIPQEQWAFAGYASPEDALTSAVWSMKEGDLETYFNGLSPSEQERMAQAWKDQPEDQIAAKHQKEAGAIQAFQIVNKQAVSANEVMMDVQIEAQGQPTVRKIRMNQVGQEWKFGGFVAPPQ